MTVILSEDKVRWTSGRRSGRHTNGRDPNDAAARNSFIFVNTSCSRLSEDAPIFAFGEFYLA